MAKYVFFDTSTGAIIRIRRCDEADRYSGVAESIPSIEVEEDLVGTTAPDTRYGRLVGGVWVVVERPTIGEPNKTMIESDGVDEVVFSDLPNPCSVIVDDEEPVIVTDGTFEFTSETPGEYVITINQWPYQDFQKVITVKA